MEYNKKHLERLAKETRLSNSSEKVWEEKELGEVEIDISGKVCKVSLIRNKKGIIEITPIDEGIEEKGGWLYEGTCTEGFNHEVIISKFIHND